MRGIAVCLFVALVAYVAAQSATPLAIQPGQEIWTAFLGDPSREFGNGVGNESSAITYAAGAGAMVCTHALSNASSGNSSAFTLSCFVHSTAQATSVGIASSASGANSSSAIFTFPSGAQLPASASFDLSAEQLGMLRRGELKGVVFGAGANGTGGNSNILLSGILKNSANFAATGVSSGSPQKGAVFVAELSKEFKTMWYYIVQNVVGAEQAAAGQFNNAGTITLWGDASDWEIFLGGEQQYAQARNVWAESMQFQAASPVITGVLPVPTLLGQFFSGFHSGNPTKAHLLLHKPLAAADQADPANRVDMPIYAAKDF